MSDKEKAAEENSGDVEVTFKKEFTCYPDGINLATFKKGKQTVSARVAKLAKDCKVI